MMGETLRDLTGGVKQGRLAPSPWSTQAVEQVQQGQDRVGEQHLRTGIAHHLANALLLSWSVTVDRALATGGFVLLERTMLQPFQGVGKQVGTFSARCGGLVMVAAVAPDHGFHCAGFPSHAR